MYSSRSLILLLLASSCKAGPLIMAIIPIIEGVSEIAAAAIASSSVAAAFGIAPCGVMFAEAVVVDGALYYGATVAAYGALAGGVAGGAAAGASAVISHGKAVTDAAVSRSIMSFRSSQSVASVSAASRWSVESKEATSAAYQTWLSLKASMDAHAPSTTPRSTNPDPFDLKTLLNVATLPETKPVSKPEHSISVPSPTVPPHTYQHSKRATSAPGSSVPPSSGTPSSTVAPLYRPPGIPPGVPDYNFRLCQNDIIQMGKNGVSFLFDQPGPQSIRVDNIPSTCMVLSTVMLGDPALGPHPIPMGSASLQWNDIKPDTINLIRMAFGQPNQTTSTH